MVWYPCLAIRNPWSLLLKQALKTIKTTGKILEVRSELFDIFEIVYRIVTNKWMVEMIRYLGHNLDPGGL